MLAGDLVNRILERLDQPDGGYYTGAEALSALNEGQRFFVLLTLALETTATFELQPATTFYHMQDTFLDWLLPLRVYNASGGNLRPARLEDLDCLDAQWVSRPGAPSRYASMGFDFFAAYPQPAALTIVNVTYARAPVALLGDSDVPEIPEEFHPDLADYGVYRLRVREGGQEFEKSLPYFQRFMKGAAKYAKYIRARNLGSRYDKLPFELERFDMSRMFRARPDLVPVRKTDGR
jgi:hypothetical protein